MSEPRFCCFIPEDQQKAASQGENVPGCQKPAQWELGTVGGSAYETLDACSEHVGNLLNGEHTNHVSKI